MSATTSPRATSTSPALISSDKVDGTDVYGNDRKKIGSIDHLMVDKRSGVVAYAVMGFGGFLGLGEDHYPIPWGSLRYDESLDGYITDIREDQIKAAPEHGKDHWMDRSWETKTHDHYGVEYYWLRGGGV